MYTHVLILIGVLGVLLGVGIWGYAYRLGGRHGRAMSVPFRLIDELLDHKIYCRGQDPSAARFELERFLGIEAWESQSLVQHAVHSARHTHVPGDNTDLPSMDKTKKGCVTP
jgi:hypothetical protein